jgi:mannose-6-phosphate isomerase
MELLFGQEVEREEVFKQIEGYLGGLAIKIASADKERPWGGFFVIDDEYTDAFITTFFPDYDREQITKFGSKLMPKILAVAPEQNLSWQYHNRRAELWRGIEGPAGYVRSNTDELGDVQILQNGGIVQFDPLERHRLVGLENWGIVAEIWQHTDANNPSNEGDIIRLEDSYGRS